LDAAATQAWTLKESLRKASANGCQPLRLQAVFPEHWATLSGNGFTAATFHTRPSETSGQIAFSFVIRNAMR